MAEGFARARLGELFEVFSAGIEKHGMNPHAMRVMEEAGVGIGAHSSKTLVELGDQEFDFVVTVCGHAHESCPVFPGDAVVVHRGFEDPPKLAADLLGEEEILDCYRRVRDEIDAYVQALPAELAARHEQAGRA